MPLKRTQSVLRKILPKWLFALLYKLACYGYTVYTVWRNIADEIYYLRSYVYYLLKRDSTNLKRIRTIYSVRPYTMVGRSGLLATYDIASEVEKSNIDGCFIECGVARGGNAALMALVADHYKSKRKMWLFDSFEGLPEPAIEDEPFIGNNPAEQKKSSSFLGKGYCLGTYDEVHKLLFTKLRLDKENIFLIKGWFQDTLPKYKNEIGQISFLRLDADWYESTKCCLENLYDNVLVGGYILIDDYWLPGCKKAVDEYLNKKGVDVEFTFDDRGGCYFVKPC